MNLKKILKSLKINKAMQRDLISNPHNAVPVSEETKNKPKSEK